MKNVVKNVVKNDVKDVVKNDVKDVVKNDVILGNQTQPMAVPKKPR